MLLFTLVFCSLFILSACNPGASKKEKIEEDLELPEHSNVDENQSETSSDPSPQNDQTDPIKNEEKYPTVLNLKKGDKISSPIKIEVNSEGLWFAFEGELGTVTLLDEQKNELGRSILSTKENWMTKDPVVFTTELKYKADKSGKGKLVFKNNNPSDNRSADQLFKMDVLYLKN